MIRWRQILLRLALLSLLPPLALVCCAVGEDLPSVLADSSAEVSTQVLDRNGQAIRELRSKDGKFSSRVALTELLLGLDRDITLILIEHDMDLALRLVEGVTVLDNGRLVKRDASGDTATVHVGLAYKLF